MRRNLVFLVMITLVLSVALTFSSCAKKVGTSDGAGEKKAVAKKQSAVDQAASQKAAAAAKAEAELKEFAAIGDVYFDYDQATIRPEGKKALEKYSKWLAAHPQYVVKIEGNCDERGTVEYNMALGEKRANSAMKYLMTLGTEKERLSSVSYGKERPVDPGHNESAWSKNRRDHFVINAK